MWLTLCPLIFLEGCSMVEEAVLAGAICQHSNFVQAVLAPVKYLHSNLVLVQSQKPADSLPVPFLALQCNLSYVLWMLAFNLQVCRHPFSGLVSVLS